MFFKTKKYFTKEENLAIRVKFLFISYFVKLNFLLWICLSDTNKENQPHKGKCLEKANLYR